MNAAPSYDCVERQSWHDQAENVSRWMLARLFVRTDRYGAYTSTSASYQPTDGPQPGALTLERLIRHCRPKSRCDIVGAIPLNEDNLGRWLAIDVDAHEAKADPAANLRFVLSIFEEVESLGFRPLLTESDGRGGYHLRVLFDRLVDGAVLHHFALYLARNHAAFGTIKHECYPKQARTEPGGNANWLRCPGLHHTRPHWSRVWDGSTWLSGDAAITFILALTGDSPGLIPQEGRDYQAEVKKPPKGKSKSAKANAGKDEDANRIFREFNSAQTMLSVAAILTRNSWEKVGVRGGGTSEERWDFRRPDKGDGWSGNLKLIDGVPIFFNFTTSTVLPADTALNPSQLRAALEFGGLEKANFARLAEALRKEGFGPEPVTIIFGPAAKDATKPPPTAGAAEEQKGPPPPTSNGGPAEEQNAATPPLVELSDVGNAHRFAVDHVAYVRYVNPWRRWYVWDEARWGEDRALKVEALAKQTANRMFQEAVVLLGKTDPASEDEAEKAASKASTARVGWARKSHSAKAQSAMLTLARSEPSIAALPEVFDTDPWALVTPSGTLDLRTGALRPNRRADYLTKLCPTEYRPDAACPEWERFLDAVFCRDQELVGYIRRLFGYSLTGLVSENVFPIFWGDGGNGKSTLLEVLMRVLGRDYSMKAPPAMLMARDHEAHPTERADLQGMRLVCAVETEEGRRLNETLIKELCGGDRIRARKMRQDFFEFEPTHKIILCTNHKPEVRGSDVGIWRRLRLIPFNARFWDPGEPSKPGEVRHESMRADKGLRARLHQEAPGILSWLVRGCEEWRRDGLGCPEQVRVATSAYRKEEDAVSEFISECCLVSASCRIQVGELYKAFKDWTEARGEQRAPTQTKFGKCMSDHGFQRTEPSNGKRWYLGITTHASTADAPWGCGAGQDRD